MNVISRKLNSHVIMDYLFINFFFLNSLAYELSKIAGIIEFSLLLITSFFFLALQSLKHGMNAFNYFSVYITHEDINE